jgi:hypothetical protein
MFALFTVFEVRRVDKNAPERAGILLKPELPICSSSKQELPDSLLPSSGTNSQQQSVRGHSSAALLIVQR